MKIGLLGLAFDSGNKGCEALGYGFLTILQKIAKKHDVFLDIDIYEECDIEKIYKNIYIENLKLKSVITPGIGTIDHINSHKKTYSECDVIFDFTAGDSFSDTYGMERFLRRTIVKILALKSTKRFVLGSQTFGPYKHIISRIMARYVLKNSYCVFSRDFISSDIVKRISNVNAKQTIDVAFAMSYNETDIKSDKKVVGFNPSGLLWGYGYTGKNEFALTIDYRQYCRETIRILVDKGYEVILVPHVLSDDMSYVDNDLVACEDLLSEFSNINMSPRFQNPIEAKSFISGLDGFIGARMHATIAAISTGVPVLPVSYSRKFEGVFGGLNYEYLIRGTEIDYDVAIQKTVEFIDNINNIKKEMDIYKKIIDEGVQFIELSTDELLGDFL